MYPAPASSRPNLPGNVAGQYGRLQPMKHQYFRFKGLIGGRNAHDGVGVGWVVHDLSSSNRLSTVCLPKVPPVFLLRLALQYLRQLDHVAFNFQQYPL